MCGVIALQKKLAGAQAFLFLPLGSGKIWKKPADARL
jgi:hypothetical protein